MTESISYFWGWFKPNNGYPPKNFCY